MLQKDSFFIKIFSICVCFTIEAIVKTPHICLDTMKPSHVESDHKLFSVTEDYNSGVTIVAAVLVSFL